MRTNIILVAFLLMLIGCGCQDVTIGFLVTNEAKYKPDTMIIRKVLDDFPGEPNPRYEQLLQMDIPRRRSVIGLAFPTGSMPGRTTIGPDGAILG